MLEVAENLEVAEVASLGNKTVLDDEDLEDEELELEELELEDKDEDDIELLEDLED